MTERIESGMAEGSDHAAAKSVQLLVCFVFLVVLHTAVTKKLMPVTGFLRPPYGDFLKWLCISGLGTLVVWFACAARPFGERLMRFFVAIIVAHWFAGLSLLHFRLPIGDSEINQTDMALSLEKYIQMSVAGDSAGMRYTNLQNVYYALVLQTNWTLVYWLLGAVFAAFFLANVTQFRFLPPDIHQRTRPTFSVWQLLLYVLFAAVLSYFLRGAGWNLRLLHMYRGGMHTVVASAVAWAVFESTKPLLQRLTLLLVMFAVILLAEAAVSSMVGIWSDWMNHVIRVTILILGLSVSPVGCFLLLRSYGYSATHAWSPRA